MLPSKGYFSSFSCPFFETRSCDRPHCHFRHCRRDKSAEVYESTTVSSVVSDKTSNRENQIGVTVKEVLYSADKKVNLENLDEMTCYMLNSDLFPNVKKTDIYKSDFEEDNVPSYKPTPIAELASKRHIPVVYAPTRPYMTDIVKRKNDDCYLPKKLSSSMTTTCTETYIPTSTTTISQNRDDLYDPNGTCNYTYCPSVIPPSVSNAVSKIDLLNDEDKLKALDDLIEEEFGSCKEELPPSVPKIDPLPNSDLTTSTSKPVESDNRVEEKSKPELSEENESTEHPSPTTKEDNISSSKRRHKRSHKRSHNNSKTSKEDKSSKKTKSSQDLKPSKLTKEPKIYKVSQSSKDLESSNSSKLPKEVKLIKDSKASESKLSKDSKSSHDTKSTHDSKSSHDTKSSHISKASHNTKSSENSKPSHDTKSTNDSKSSHDTKLSHAPKSSHHSKSSEDSKTSHDTKSSLDAKSSIDTKSSKSYKDSRSTNEIKSSKDSSKQNNLKDKHKSSTKHSKSSSSGTSSNSKSQIDFEKKGEITHQSKSKRSSEHKTDCRKSSKHEEKSSHSKKGRSDDERENTSSSHCRHSKSSKRRSEYKTHRHHETFDHPSKKNRKDDPKTDSGESNDDSNDSSDVQEVYSPKETIVIESSDSSMDVFDNRAQWTDSPPEEPLHSPCKRKKEEPMKSVFESQPQSVLCERWRKAREAVQTKSGPPGKVKITQVPNVHSFLNAKDRLLTKPKPNIAKPPPPASQVEEYVPRPVVRKAHTPSVAVIKYPVVIMEENLKVPVNIRQPCLNNIYDEYRKYCNPDLASRRAQEDELEICRRLHVSKTYQNAVAMAILRIRKNKGSQVIERRSEESTSAAPLFSDSIPEFTYGETLYECFAKYILTNKEYIENGYPIQKSTRKDCAYIEKSARRPSSVPTQPADIDANERCCIFCAKLYTVNDFGVPLEEYNCFYHSGKLRKSRERGGGLEFFCCNGEPGSDPCTIGRYHICNLYDEDNLEGFVSTKPMKEEPDETKAGIYAIDCEMCYTTRGLDLARCTVVDLNGKVIYDQNVKPDDILLDCCTRFSGMTEDMIHNAKRKLKDVQRDLLKFISEKTILVGHSLENDLKALRMFHRTVVDTSIVFPHPSGIPIKYSLKRLAKEILNISIQDKESGHDSFEDANSCMKLMLWKIKEDAKERKPRRIISLASKGVSKKARGWPG